ncbi:MAG: hypothetical protein C0421_08585 [Hyphomonas sp.]|uniref:hypothetical protein n=1 Tax=Hyphomonas sp. TaxID=87 RepID=UPI0025C39BDA|nr:hypothetical protein [Hyphomonas sp.]MBA4338887.1 hypothetical protein [Hyphomonas sp.]
MVQVKGGLVRAAPAVAILPAMPRALTLDITREYAAPDRREDHNRLYAVALDFPSYWLVGWDDFGNCLEEMIAGGTVSLHVYHPGWTETDLAAARPYLDLITRLAARHPAVTFSAGAAV